MKVVLYIFILVFPALGFTLSGKDYLEKINRNYANLKAFELQMSYQLYKGYSGNEVLQTYSGNYIKNEVKAYRKIKSTEFIHFNKITLQVNHDEKLVILDNRLDAEFMEIDLKSALKQCQDIKLLKKEKGVLVTLVLKNETDIPYSKVSLLVDNSYWIKEMTFYYAAQMNFGTYQNKDMAYPKLRIQYEQFKKGTKKLDDLEISNFIDLGASKPALVGDYATYKLIDARKNN